MRKICEGLNDKFQIAFKVENTITLTLMRWDGKDLKSTEIITVLTMCTKILDRLLEMLFKKLLEEAVVPK